MFWGNRSVLGLTGGRGAGMIRGNGWDVSMMHGMTEDWGPTRFGRRRADGGEASVRGGVGAMSGGNEDGSVVTGSRRKAL